MRVQRCQSAKTLHVGERGADAVGKPARSCAASSVARHHEGQSRRESVQRASVAVCRFSTSGIELRGKGSPVRPFATIRKGIPRRSPANAIRSVEMGPTAFPLDAEFDAILTGLLCRQGSEGSSFRFGRAAAEGEGTERRRRCGRPLQEGSVFVCPSRYRLPNLLRRWERASGRSGRYLGSEVRLDAPNSCRNVYKIVYKPTCLQNSTKKAFRNSLLRKALRSGAEEGRTPDLCIANAALSQLSYRPNQSVHFTRGRTALQGRVRDRAPFSRHACMPRKRET